MAEINKLINGYHIYICGTWCEVTKGGNYIYDGSVEEGMTAEEVYKQITKEVVFSYNGKELCAYDWLHEFSGERQATRELLAAENSCNVEDIEVSFRYAEI
ncbi:MAG: hypothetical protein K2N34_12585 [Lachnospiraceae bacterium]|nr:hypothetical protein [Lachnospiraceae bacterium]